MIDIRPYLDDLEQRIDPAGEQELQAAWDTFVRGECTDDLFIPRRSYTAPPRIEWPQVSINQAQHNCDCMALSQLSTCSWALTEGNGRLLCVRCNYGTPILPSLFGVTLYYMEEELNTLPTCLPLAGGVEAIRARVAAGVPEIDRALWHEVRAMARHFQQLFAPYPRIREWVHLYHPDVQGPMDCVELLWGSSLFLALHDMPELVRQTLQLLTDTYTAVMDDWFDLVPPNADTSYHWSMYQPGRIMLRDDSAMNLSPEMFAGFIAPYDAQLLQRYGGAIHFCGRGDHYIEHAASLPGLRAINMSQPELNDMETIYRHTVDQGVFLLDLRRDAAEAALAANRDLHGRVHCW